MSWFSKHILEKTRGFGSRRMKTPKFEENKRFSYFGSGSSRDLMFGDESDNNASDEQTGDVFKNRRRGSVFGSDFANMFGN